MNADILNSREWAILIWVLIAIAYIARVSVWQTLKESLLRLLGAIASRHIISSITFMAIYVVVIIYGLSQLGLWDSSLLKESLIWFFSVAIFSLFQLNKFLESPKQLKTLVFDNLKLVVVIEYLVGVYTFNFAVELVLVPLVSIISIMLAYTQLRPEHEQAQKFLNGVSIIVGIVIIASATYLLFKNFQQVANRQAALEFFMPIILSIFYTPFMGFMIVYSTYQTVLIRLRYSITQRHAEIYARFAAMLIFNLRIGMLERWSTNVAKCQIQTIEEVNHSFRQFFHMMDREKSPDEIFLPEGWSPNKARNFLLSEGIKTSHYNPIDPMNPLEWFSGSTPVQFGSGLHSNKIAYYLNGNERAVNSLKLKLNVNQSEHAEEAHAKLISSAETLTREALGLDLGNVLSKAITLGQEGVFNGQHFKITITKAEYLNQRYGGYDLIVEVSVI